MGVLMSVSGYVGGAAVQVDSAIMMIRVLASVAPLALMLVVAAILRLYTVDKQMPQIKQDLEARAAATTEAAPPNNTLFLRAGNLLCPLFRREYE